MSFGNPRPVLMNFDIGHLHQNTLSRPKKKTWINFCCICPIPELLTIKDNLTFQNMQFLRFDLNYCKKLTNFIIFECLYGPLPYLLNMYLSCLSETVNLQGSKCKRFLNTRQTVIRGTCSLWDVRLVDFVGLWQNFVSLAQWLCLIYLDNPVISYVLPSALFVKNIYITQKLNAY